MALVPLVVGRSSEPREAVKPLVVKDRSSHAVRACLMSETRELPKPWKSLIRRGGIAALRLFLAGLLLGWFYAWAAPFAYPKERPLGFPHGMLHGALMPMALPSLLLGSDVDIFAANQNGRRYKIGYICGINLCGLLFFGAAFAKPKAKAPPTTAADRSSAPV